LQYEIKNFNQVKIGNLELPEQPLLLAPMEDVSDPSFRYMCKHYGADLLYTEFVASEALIRNIDKTKRKLEIFDYERPIGIQLYGHNIDAMVESARIATESKPDLIDINYGCPVKKIATRGAGAGMLQDIPKMVRMTAEIVKATHLPVTVKTRLGWDESTKFIVDIAERLQDVGIKALTIHGRTRSQLFKGEADWTLIGDVKNNQRMTIPIIGNGDIDSAEKAKLYFDRYHVDGMMIGRATYGRPWIFKEIRHFLQTGELLPLPDVNERVQVAKLHLNRSLEWKGPIRGMYEMRRHLITYFKAFPNFKEYRMRLVTTLNPKEIETILDEIAVKYQGNFFEENNEIQTIVNE